MIFQIFSTYLVLHWTINCIISLILHVSYCESLFKICFQHIMCILHIRQCFLPCVFTQLSYQDHFYLLQSHLLYLQKKHFFSRYISFSSSLSLSFHLTASLILIAPLFHISTAPPFVLQKKPHQLHLFSHETKNFLHKLSSHFKISSRKHKKFVLDHHQPSTIFQKSSSLLTVLNDSYQISSPNFNIFLEKPRISSTFIIKLQQFSRNLRHQFLIIDLYQLSGNPSPYLQKNFVNFPKFFVSSQTSDNIHSSISSHILFYLQSWMTVHPTTKHPH